MHKAPHEIKSQAFYHSSLAAPVDSGFLVSGWVLYFLNSKNARISIFKGTSIQP